MKFNCDNNIKNSSSYYHFESCTKLNYVYTSRQCDEYFEYLEELRRIIFGKQTVSKYCEMSTGQIETIHYHTNNGKTLVYNLDNAAEYGIELSPIPSETETTVTETFLANEHVLPSPETAKVIPRQYYTLPFGIEERMRACLHASAEAINFAYTDNEEHSIGTTNVHDDHTPRIQPHTPNYLPNKIPVSEVTLPCWQYTSVPELTDFQEEKNLNDIIDEDFAVLEEFASVLEETASVFDENGDDLEDRKCSISDDKVRRIVGIVKRHYETEYTQSVCVERPEILGTQDEFEQKCNLQDLADDDSLDQQNEQDNEEWQHLTNSVNINTNGSFEVTSQNIKLVDMIQNYVNMVMTATREINRQGEEEIIEGRPYSVENSNIQDQLEEDFRQAASPPQLEHVSDFHENATKDHDPHITSNVPNNVEIDGSQKGELLPWMHSPNRSTSIRKSSLEKWESSTLKHELESDDFTSTLTTLPDHKDSSCTQDEQLEDKKHSTRAGLSQSEKFEWKTWLTKSDVLNCQSQPVNENKIDKKKLLVKQSDNGITVNSDNKQEQLSGDEKKSGELFVESGLGPSTCEVLQFDGDSKSVNQRYGQISSESSDESNKDQELTILDGSVETDSIPEKSPYICPVLVESPVEEEQDVNVETKDDNGVEQNLSSGSLSNGDFELKNDDDVVNVVDGNVAIEEHGVEGDSEPQVTGESQLLDDELDRVLKSLIDEVLIAVSATVEEEKERENHIINENLDRVLKILINEIVKAVSTEIKEEETRAVPNVNLSPEISCKELELSGFENTKDWGNTDQNADVTFSSVNSTCDDLLSKVAGSEFVENTVNTVMIAVFEEFSIRNHLAADCLLNSSDTSFMYNNSATPSDVIIAETTLTVEDQIIADTAADDKFNHYFSSDPTRGDTEAVADSPNYNVPIDFNASINEDLLDGFTKQNEKEVVEHLVDEIVKAAVEELLQEQPNRIKEYSSISQSTSSQDDFNESCAGTKESSANSISADKTERSRFYNQNSEAQDIIKSTEDFVRNMAGRIMDEVFEEVSAKLTKVTKRRGSDEFYADCLEDVNSVSEAEITDLSHFPCVAFLTNNSATCDATEIVNQLSKKIADDILKNVFEELPSSVRDGNSEIYFEERRASHVFCEHELEDQNTPANAEVNEDDQVETSEKISLETVTHTENVTNGVPPAANSKVFSESYANMDIVIFNKNDSYQFEQEGQASQATTSIESLPISSETIETPMYQSSTATNSIDTADIFPFEALVKQMVDKIMEDVVQKWKYQDSEDKLLVSPTLRENLESDSVCSVVTALGEEMNTERTSITSLFECFTETTTTSSSTSFIVVNNKDNYFAKQMTHEIIEAVFEVIANGRENVALDKCLEYYTCNSKDEVRLSSSSSLSSLAGSNICAWENDADNQTDQYIDDTSMRAINTNKFPVEDWATKTFRSNEEVEPTSSEENPHSHEDSHEVVSSDSWTRSNSQLVEKLIDGILETVVREYYQHQTNGNAQINVVFEAPTSETESHCQSHDAFCGLEEIVNTENTCHDEFFESVVPEPKEPNKLPATPVISLTDKAKIMKFDSNGNETVSINLTGGSMNRGTSDMTNAIPHDNRDDSISVQEVYNAEEHSLEEKMFDPNSIFQQGEGNTTIGHDESDTKFLRNDNVISSALLDIISENEHRNTKLGEREDIDSTIINSPMENEHNDLSSVVTEVSELPRETTDIVMKFEIQSAEKYEIGLTEREESDKERSLVIDVNELETNVEPTQSTDIHYNYPPTSPICISETAGATEFRCNDEEVLDETDPIRHDQKDVTSTETMTGPETFKNNVVPGEINAAHSNMLHHHSSFSTDIESNSEKELFFNNQSSGFFKNTLESESTSYSVIETPEMISNSLNGTENVTAENGNSVKSGVMSHSKKCTPDNEEEHSDDSLDRATSGFDNPHVQYQDPDANDNEHPSKNATVDLPSVFSEIASEFEPRHIIMNTSSTYHFAPFHVCQDSELDDVTRQEGNTGTSVLVSELNRDSSNFCSCVDTIESVLTNSTLPRETSTIESSLNSSEPTQTSSVLEEVCYFLTTVCVAAVAMASSSENDSPTFNSSIIEDAGKYFNNQSDDRDNID